MLPIYASLGGKIQGPKNAESGHMRCIQKLSDVVENGRKGGQICKELSKGAFCNPDIHRQCASLGGQAQGKINAENGHLKKIAQQYWEDVRSGKIKRTKRIWVNNGNEEKQIILEEDIPENFIKGRLKK